MQFCAVKPLTLFAYKSARSGCFYVILYKYIIIKRNHFKNIIVQINNDIIQNSYWYLIFFWIVICFKDIIMLSKNINICNLKSINSIILYLKKLIEKINKLIVVITKFEIECIFIILFFWFISGSTLSFFQFFNYIFHIVIINIKMIHFLTF